MLDHRHVLENLDEVRRMLARRSAAAAATLDQVSTLADKRRALITRVEELRAKRNSVSADIAKLDKKGPEFAARREEMRAVGDELKALEPKLTESEVELETLMLLIPNVPDPEIPDGDSEEHNQVVRTWGEKPTFTFAPKDHVAIGELTRTLDFDRGVKLGGTRFTVLMRGAARLERALMMFMLDLHSNEHGYTEVWPPVLVKDTAMRGTGQLPKFENDAFQIAMRGDDPDERRLFLAPTAEVPVTNLHSDEILDGAALPIAYAAYTPCFRSEAGSAGRDTRGLIRQHQFDKVEIVRFVRPEDGRAELEKLTSHAEEVLKRLNLHYRVSLLCAGDMGANSRRTYDLEVWLPGQNAYREISSCSWFGDFQARRARIRFRKSRDDKPELVHTLNGSALAIGRTLVAIYEQCQQEDGSIAVPTALAPYMGGLNVIPVHG